MISRCAVWRLSGHDTESKGGHIALIIVNGLKAGFRCSASEHMVAVSRLFYPYRQSTAETACCVILKLSQHYL